MPDLDGAGRLHRGRRAAADLPVLPPALDAGVPGCADPAPGRRADHQRDRPRPSWPPRPRWASGSRAPRRRSPRPGRSSSCPTGAERDSRLDDVMAVIYLIFNEGYSATAGERLDASRPGARGDAAGPDAADARARRARGARAAGAAGAPGARAAPPGSTTTGRPVLLEAQDRGRWDALLIRRGLAALRARRALAARGKPVGRYFLQASIASQHARADHARGHRLARRSRALYDVLAEAAPGPVVEVNRAVAHGRAFGPGCRAGRPRQAAAGALGDSPLLPSVRGDLLDRAGRHAEAAAAFREAATLTRNEGERTLLLTRADDVDRKSPMSTNGGRGRPRRR